jgi:hypothetical protein
VALVAIEQRERRALAEATDPSERMRQCDRAVGSCTSAGATDEVQVRGVNVVALPRPAVDEPEIWSRQVGESTKAYTFSVLRDLEPENRSLGSAYRQHTGKEQAMPPGQWAGWSTHWDWARRAAEWDAHVYREVRAKRLRERIQWRDQHVRFGYVMVGKAIARGERNRLGWALCHGAKQALRDSRKVDQ